MTTSADVAAKVVAHGGKAEVLSDLDALVEHAVENVAEGDVVVTMGAGDVDRVARGLAERLR